MIGKNSIVLMLLIPIVGSALCMLAGWLTTRRVGEKQGRRAYEISYLAVLAATFAAAMLCAIPAWSGESDTLHLNLCYSELSFRIDGFRALYCMLASFAWLASGVFSIGYCKHKKKVGRYYFFVLLTLGATLGVFAAADLYALFLFFEVMSVASYVWVAEEETEAAIEASKTYLAVAVIGGLVMLMGLFLLQHLTGTLELAALSEAATLVEDKTLLYVAGGCLLFGFGAKAGAFPLHIWLPKAHPVAPAPASALLSGILTKAGVLGVFLLSGQLFLGDRAWGNLIMILGTLTMLIGAAVALFSIDMKQTLACSSVSQIGFILVGLGALGILEHENALAVHGAILHMTNHSLFKLVLFLLAGVVVMNLESRDFNVIRGFGRNKPWFLVCYLLGAFGIGGVPLFSGYVSKSMLHEAILECYHETGLGMYKGIELLFLFAGGCTVAYMLKLFFVLFVSEPSKEVLAHQRATKEKGYLSLAGKLSITIPAVLILVLGALPELTMFPIAKHAEVIAHCHGESEHIALFSWECLKGAVISLSVGAVLYAFLVRPAIRKKTSQGIVYVNRWPEVLDLEKSLYRPLVLEFFPFLGTVIAGAVEVFLNVVTWLKGAIFFGTLGARILDSITEGLTNLLQKIFLKPVYREKTTSTAEVICNGIGHVLNAGTAALNATVWRRNPREKDFVHATNLVREELSESLQLVSRSLSYGLLAFCIGLLILMVYLLLGVS